MTTNTAPDLSPIAAYAKARRSYARKLRAEERRVLANGTANPLEVAMRGAFIRAALEAARQAERDARNAAYLVQIGETFDAEGIASMYRALLERKAA